MYKDTTAQLLVIDTAGGAKSRAGALLQSALLKPIENFFSTVCFANSKCSRRANPTMYLGNIFSPFKENSGNIWGNIWY